MTLTATHARGAGFLAAQMIHQNRITIIHAANLFGKIHFGKNPRHRSDALARAIDAGWLAKDKNGGITLGAPAVEFFAEKPGEAPKYVGKVAAPRLIAGAYDRPALKYKTNSRGDHARVIDDRFQRPAGFSPHSVPTGAV